jgi:hypothetical protein
MRQRHPLIAVRHAQILKAKKMKKRKKARQVGARLRQDTTTPSLAAGPLFPTPATPPPPPHAGRTARSAAALPQQLRRELGPPGAWAAARVGRESPRCDRDEEGGSRRAAAGAGVVADGSKRESRRYGRNQCLRNRIQCWTAAHHYRRALGRRRRVGRRRRADTARSDIGRRPTTAAAPWGGGGWAAALWGRRRSDTASWSAMPAADQAPPLLPPLTE